MVGGKLGLNNDGRVITTDRVNLFDPHLPRRVHTIFTVTLYLVNFVTAKLVLHMLLMLCKQFDPSHVPRWSTFLHVSTITDWADHWYKHYIYIPVGKQKELYVSAAQIIFSCLTKWDHVLHWLWQVFIKPQQMLHTLWRCCTINL